MIKVDALLKAGSPEEIDLEIRFLEKYGFSGAWTFEAKNDPFLPLSFAIRSSNKINLGTNITVAFARTPFALAQTAWDLQKFSRGRFNLGLGTQVKSHIERRYSVQFDKPAARIEEYIRCIKSIWDCFQTGKQPDFDGHFYKFSLLTDFFNPGPIKWPRIPIYLAGVNPLMCEVAGKVADGFHVHPMHTVEFLKDMVIPNVNKGLISSEEPERNFELYAPIFVITGETYEEKLGMERVVRQQIAFYGSTPNYAVLFQYHGYPDLGKKLNLSLKRGELDTMGDLIPDELLEKIVIIDNPENLAQRIIDRYLGVLNRFSVYSFLDDEQSLESFKNLPSEIINILAVNKN